MTKMPDTVKRDYAEKSKSPKVCCHSRISTGKMSVSAKFGKVPKTPMKTDKFSAASGSDVNRGKF